MRQQENAYITTGILEDVNNDRMITMSIRTDIGNALKNLAKYQDMGAMAYHEDMIPKLIDALDDALANTVHPVDALIDEGERYHEQRHDA